MKVAIARLLNRRDRRGIALDVDEELQSHIEMLERKFNEHGMSPADAKAAALRRFGNTDRVRRQCIAISRRNNPLRRSLKTFSILLAVAGLAIHILSSDYKVAHIGETLIMIAISGRLLLYVRGLLPSISSHADKKASLSILSERREDVAS
jgi:hypothetical protein